MSLINSSLLQTLLPTPLNLFNVYCHYCAGRSLYQLHETSKFCCNVNLS